MAEVADVCVFCAPVSLGAILWFRLFVRVETAAACDDATTGPVNEENGFWLGSFFLSLSLYPGFLVAFYFLFLFSGLNCTVLSVDTEKTL